MNTDKPILRPKMFSVRNSSYNYLAITGLFFILTSFIGPVYGQYTQTVRGKITDKVTSSPLPGVYIILNNKSLNIGAVADSNGEFTLKKVPVGRNTFTFTRLGYEPVLIKDIVVSSGKELSPSG